MQRRQHVERAHIAGLGELGPAQLGEMQMTENVEAMVDGDDHDVVMGREDGPVEPRRVGRAIRDGAAMVPDHDGALAAVADATREHVERQAILALRHGIACARKAGELGPLLAIGRRLRRMPGPCLGAAHARPRLRFARRHEACTPTGRCKALTPSTATPRILPDVVSATGASAASARVTRIAGSSAAAAAACEAPANKARRSIPAKRLLTEKRRSDPKLRGVMLVFLPVGFCQSYRFCHEIVDTMLRTFQLL